jgi:hypothetical protein
MVADQVPGSTPPSGNLFEGTPGFTNFGGVVTPSGGYPGEHSDIPGATPSATPSTAPGVPVGWSGSTSDFVVSPGFNAGGVILGGMNTPSFGQPSGMPGAPAGAKSATGKGDDTDTVSEADVDQALSDMAASMQAANAVSQAMPGAPTPDPSDYDFGAPGTFASSYSPAVSQAMSAQAATTAPAGGKSGFAGVGLPGMVADMTAQGMPSPGGGTFSSGWGSTLADLGDLGAPGAVDTAGLTDTGPMGGGGMDFGGSATGGNAGPGVGMSEGAAAAAADAGSAAAAAAAGGSAGFGGMGAGGGVGPGGMSTGGTGETGSVADPGGTGTGGVGGAGMGGGVGSPGTGDFGGAATGSADTSGGGQGDLGSGDGGPGTI